jgi:hexosaminidase
LQAYFNSRLAVILAKHHKRMIGWDEIMEGDLPPGTVVQSWRGPGVLAEAAVKGYPVILSYGLYLDHILPAEAHYGVDPIPAGYRGDPGLIWGGEACMWGEQISAPTVDSRIWPRLLGVGERLWSPATVGDIDDYYRRAEAVSRNLAEVGLGHEAHTVSMLARLAPAEARAPLERLLEIAVPVSFSERSRLQRPLTTTAHDRLVDVARPDAWRTRRTLIRLVARFLADTAGHLAGRDSLLAMVAGWREVAAQVAGLPRNSALVADAAPVATALGQMAEAAGAAIEAIAAGRTFDPSRSAAAKTLLGRVASPQGLLRLDVLPGIETLLTAAMTGRPTP